MIHFHEKQRLEDRKATQKPSSRSCALGGTLWCPCVAMAWQGVNVARMVMESCILAAGQCSIIFTAHQLRSTGVVPL